jgi:protein-tyrosine phosphatase
VVGHILFVCTGNTGRSVAAEALARHWIAARGLAITIGSRGVAADAANERPEPHVESLLAACGIDVGAHRATQLTATDISAAGLILTMTAAHKRTVLERFPAAAGRVQMLSEAASGAVKDVPDAFGASLGVYEAVLAQLDSLVSDALSRVVG